MEVRKGKFKSFSDEEKTRYISSLRKRIENGYLDSEKVIDGIIDKLASGFEEELAKYC